jgi:hypothetical protein
VLAIVGYANDQSWNVIFLDDRPERSLGKLADISSDRECGV